ncbi:hypothetical protein HS3_03256 [Bacillus subtilis]|nr:hypothetical protein HS3_03256 [Bacillus subtilis]
MAVQIKRGFFFEPSFLNCQAAALFSTGEAGFRTCLAMIMIVLSAFSAACFTNIGAKCTNFFHKRAVRLHGFDRQRANIRAFPVKPDAAAEMMLHAFFQAFSETMIASLHTIDASLNTSFRILLHGGFPLYDSIWFYVSRLHLKKTGECVFS